MRKKKFLTEEDRLKSIAEKSKQIVESFTKQYNKIKREGETEIKEDLTKQVTTDAGTWDEKSKKVSQGNLPLNNDAKQIYSLFKKVGANPTLQTGQGRFGDNEKRQNVHIEVQNNDLIIQIFNVPDAMGMANKYGPSIVQKFPNLTLKDKPSRMSDGKGVTFSFSAQSEGTPDQVGGQEGSPQQDNRSQQN